LERSVIVKKMKKKYLLFDNDGVLVETEPYYYEANVKALREFGLDLSFDAYMEIMARGGNAWEVASKLLNPSLPNFIHYIDIYGRFVFLFF